MDAHLIDTASPTWSPTLDQINARLQAGNNPTLLPNQFTQVVLPRLGGHIVSLREAGQELGIGFILPRGVIHAMAGGRQARRLFTLRYHAMADDGYPAPRLAQAVIQAVTSLLHGAEVYFYDPAGPLHYQATYRDMGAVNIGRPSTHEAAQIPLLQQQIWGSPPEFLYPADIHSVEFQLGSSLVARVDGQIAGFLFGFHKFDGPPLPADWTARFGADLRLESQTLGVLPKFRGMRIGNLLKQAQAEEAWQAGIGVIQWTADPLQFPNAALNFGLLRALAFHFYPDLYPFRNDLNRVPASRFGLTWLVGSERAQKAPVQGGGALVLDLHEHSEIQRVNSGFDQLDFTAGSAQIAIEIPADWTALQQQDIDIAYRWRAATDRLFDHYVGVEPGQYVITGVARERESYFLTGERVDDTLWQQLGIVGSQNVI